MNKFTKLLLSGALLVAPSYGTTDFVIDANLDYTDGGTLNVNVDATLGKDKTITLGEKAVGNIKAEKTLTNNGIIEYNVKNEDGTVTGVFKAGAGVIDQCYDAGKVKGSIKLTKIEYSVKEGALLDENTTNTLTDITSITTQKKLYDGYSEGKMTPDLATLSAPIQYKIGEEKYTFGKQSSNEGIIPDRIKVTTENDTTQFEEYLSEFGISAITTSASKTNGNSRIQALASSTDTEAILIPDDIDKEDTVKIEMAEEDKTINGNLHNTNQSETIKFTKPAAGTVGILTLSGNNSYLKNVEFGALNAGVPVNFSGLNSIPVGTVNCYGAVSTGDSGANLLATATLTIKGASNSISGKIKAIEGSAINIGE